MRWKVWLFSATVIGLSVVGLRSYLLQKAEPTQKYATVTVDRGPIKARVRANGTLSALTTVQIGSQVSGRISQIAVDFNSKVKKGQVLAKLDSALFQASLAQARAHRAASVGALAKAKANAEIAVKRLVRSQLLASQKLLAEANLNQAEADAAATAAEVEAAKGNLDEAEATLRQAQVNLSYTTILSPIDGVVISRNVDVGQTVAASLQAPTLFTIAGDLAKMQVDTTVAEADVGKLRVGMTSEFSVDAFPNLVFTGTIRDVRNAPQTVQGIVTYDAVVDVDNSASNLKPGMTAHVAFIYSEVPDVLRVANVALRFRPVVERGVQRKTNSKRPDAARAVEGEPEPSLRRIWLLKGNQPKSFQVKTGVTDGTVTEIITGDVRPSDQAIVELLDEEDTGQTSGNAKPLFRLF